MPTAKVYCKSCASMKEVDDEAIQLAVTSLPNIFSKIVASEEEKEDTSWLLLYNRSYVMDKTLPFLAPMANELARILKDDGCFVLNIGCTPDNPNSAGFASLIPLIFAEYIVMKSPLKFLYDILIVQQPDGQGRVAGSKYIFERGIIIMQQHLLVFAKHTPPRINAPGLIPSVWTYETVAPPTVENVPTPFSLTVISKLLQLFTKEGDTVLDPCAGLGTLWVVARGMRRNAILYEKNPEFVEIMRKQFPEIESNA